MTEVIPGIHQVQIPIPNNPLGYTNSYLVQGDNGYLLIDPGIDTDEAFTSLKMRLSEINVGFEDITQVVATHAHPDHYGLAHRLKQLSQTKILLHYRDRDFIQSMHTRMGDHMKQAEQWFLINGAPSLKASEFQISRGETPSFTTPTMPDITLNGGEIITYGIFHLQVLWTPGHSPGHICLYEPTKKILFSGDHVLPVVTPNISLQPQSNANPLGDFLNSLNIVKRLDVNIILPAHEHVFHNLQSRVEEIVRHHQQRNSEILETMKWQPKTAYQVSSGVTWMPELGGISFQDLTPWNKRLAILETLAHLETMRTDGRVEKNTTDSIIYYQPT
ncbi:MBL fold metallo-hydrolase [Chloroflexota bacterium]